jgi:hypothetical protein
MNITTRLTVVTDFTAGELDTALVIVKFADRLKRSSLPSGERLTPRELAQARRLLVSASEILERHRIQVKGKV